MDKFEFLKKVYEDIGHPISFSGPYKIFEYIKKNSDRKDISLRDIKQFLKGQSGYTFHGNIPRTYLRLPIKVAGPGIILGCDLADMNNYVASFNDNYRYILVLIDIFSRKVSLTALKNKTCSNFAIALEKYLKTSPYNYSYVYSDDGKEFLGKAAQKIYKKYKIHRYSVKSRKFKCSIAERFIRTMKEKLYKYFSQFNTFKFIDILEKLETAYNSSKHRGLCGYTPFFVHKMTGLAELKKHGLDQMEQKLKNYSAISVKNEKNSLIHSQELRLGGFVRLLLTDAERCFAKSHEKIFTPEIFVIREIDNTFPVTYKLKDLKGRLIDGVVYARELKPVVLPDKFEIDKVLSTRQNPNTGKLEYLVRWMGFGDDFNSYVDKLYKI